MHINGETKLIGFFGTTYRTSKMYAVYNAALQALGLNYLYVPFAVDDLAQAVAGVRHLGVAAVGVTVPYKIAILPYLDALDTAAQQIGAVNVVVNESGRLVGGNTDGLGALRALEERGPVRSKPVLLLGAGGAARALAFALHAAGARLHILNRTVAHAQDLAAAVGPDVQVGGYALLPAVLRPETIVINATSVGMVNTPEVERSLVPAHLLHPSMRVMELVSVPHATRLTRDAVAAGCTVVYGDRMLLWQSVYKFKMYTGVEPPVEVMEAALGK